MTSSLSMCFVLGKAWHDALMMCIDDVSLYWADVTFHMSISMFFSLVAFRGIWLFHLTWRRWRMTTEGLTPVVTIRRIWFDIFVYPYGSFPSSFA